jgi:hypothetical protein
MRSFDDVLRGSSGVIGAYGRGRRTLLATACRARAEHRAWWARWRFVAGGLQIIAFGVLPVLLTTIQLQRLLGGHLLAVDFTQGPWIAGHRLFAGLSPYVGAHSPHVTGIAFVYPAVAAFLLSPFSLLPQGAGGDAFVALNLAAVLLTLRALDVRDWRLYGVCLMWPAVIAGWETANITLLLGLGIALLWRYRAHPAAAGGLIALLISVKLFLWPLALWLAATKRYTALGYAAAIGLAMNVLAWGVLGFDQIGRYRALVDALARSQESRGYSVVAFVVNRGDGRALAYAVMLGISALLACACLAAGRRGGGRPAFALSVGICLVATPISWLHYFALLLIPLALARPRLSALWLVPLLFQFPTLGPSARQTAITFAVAAAIIAVAVISSARDPQVFGTVVARSSPITGEAGASP